MNSIEINVEDLKKLLNKKTSLCIDINDYTEIIKNIPLRNKVIDDLHFIANHFISTQGDKFILKTIDDYGMIDHNERSLYCYINDSDKDALSDKRFVIYNNENLYIYEKRLNISYYNKSYLESILLFEKMIIVSKYENIFTASDFKSLNDNLNSLYNEEASINNNILLSNIDRINSKIKQVFKMHQHRYTDSDKNNQRKIAKMLLANLPFNSNNITEEVINDINLINRNLLDIYKSYKKDLSNCLPHDYKYIESLLLGTIDIRDSITNLSNVANIYIAKKKIDDIKNLLLIIESQLIIDYKNNKKGIWYYPYLSIKNIEDSPAEIIRKLDTLKQMGINIIYFYPFYKQRLVYLSAIYQSICNNKEDDYISFFINEAHKRKMSVYAFTQPLYARVDSLINKPLNSASMYQRDYNNNIAFDVVKFYDVSNDDVLQLIITWYKELVAKFDFDGIEFDMIRYPYSNLFTFSFDTIENSYEIIDTGYTKSMIKKFTNKDNVNIDDFKRKIATNKNFRQAFTKFKEKELFLFLEKLINEIKLIKPSIKISASVINDYHLAKKAYLQDYKKWLNYQLISNIEPMVYFDKFDDFIIQARKYEKSTTLGIFGRQNQTNKMDNIKEIKYCEEKGGYILFSSYQYLDDDAFTALLINNHHHLSISCINSSSEIYKVLLEKLRDLLEYYLGIENEHELHYLYSKLNDYNLDQLKKVISQLTNQKIRKVLLESINL